MKAQSDDEAHSKGIMLRDKRYKYVSRLHGSDELYDLEADPGETTNIIGQEVLQPVIADMRYRMLKWLEGTADIVPFERDARFTPEMMFARARAIVPPHHLEMIREKIREGITFTQLMALCRSLADR